MSPPEQLDTTAGGHCRKRVSSPLEGPSLKRHKTRLSWTDEDSSQRGQVFYRPPAKMVPSFAKFESNSTIRLSCKLHGHQIRFHGPYYAWLYTQRALSNIASTLNANQ